MQERAPCMLHPLPWWLDETGEGEETCFHWVSCTPLLLSTISFILYS
jgi:hypothetical protein